MIKPCRLICITAGYNAEVARTGFTNNGQDANVDASNTMVGVNAYTVQASVTSKTPEFGLRGNINNKQWRLAVFRTELNNDIIFNELTVATG